MLQFAKRGVGICQSAQQADLGSWLLPSWLLVLPDAAIARASPMGRPPDVNCSTSAERRGLIMWEVSSPLRALPALRRMPLGGRALTPSPSDLSRHPHARHFSSLKKHYAHMTSHSLTNLH